VRAQWPQCSDNTRVKDRYQYLDTYLGTPSWHTLAAYLVTPLSTEWYTCKSVRPVLHTYLVCTMVPWYMCMYVRTYTCTLRHQPSSSASSLHQQPWHTLAHILAHLGIPSWHTLAHLLGLPWLATPSWYPWHTLAYIPRHTFLADLGRTH
jgi:hypothetical protein